MKTIAQLIEENGGKLPLKVITEYTYCTFIEIFFIAGNIAHGKDSNGCARDLVAGQPLFQLYTEPKPVEKFYLYSGAGGIVVYGSANMDQSGWTKIMEVLPMKDEV